VLLDRRRGDRPAFGLADHADESGLRQHRLGEFVHPRGGGRPRRPHGLVAHGIDRAHVVDEPVREVDRQFFTTVHHLRQALVCGVAPGQQLAGQQQPLA